MKLLAYSLKNSIARKLTFILTVSGIGLVVFVFCAVFMLSNGLEQVLVDTGYPENATMVRESATSEVISIIGTDQADVIKVDRAIARDSEGVPMVAGELVVLISQPRIGTEDQSNITVRGVDEMSVIIRPQVKLAEGRMFRPGTSEIMAGIKVAEGFQGGKLGQTLNFGQRDWKIVGLIEANGSGFESEIWGDVDQMQDAFQRPIYSSFTARLADPSEFDAFEKRLEDDRRLTVDAMREVDYYRVQSQAFTTFINILGTMISIVFSLGAIVGAMITMYAAVANRTREIGTLRALGFGRPSILFAFLFESLFIALVGGLIGVAAANLLGLKEVSTTNFTTFAQISFGFEMSWTIAVSAIIFSLIMGIVGGFLPAVRASRLQILSALRAK